MNGFDRENRRVEGKVRWRPLAVALALLASGLPALAGSGSGKFCSAETLRLEEGEVFDGDRYVGARVVQIKGRHDGDLIGWGQKIRIDGVVTGDLIFTGESLDIDGEVLDTVRFFGGSATIRGTIDGDLMFFGGELNIDSGGRVTGSVMVFAGMVTVDGTVDGDLSGGGGEIAIGGTIGGNVELEVDTIRLKPGAGVAGNLTYESRKELQTDGEPAVGGEIIYKKKVPKDDDESGVSAFSVLWWLFLTLSAMVVGLVLLALLRRLVPSLLRPLESETMVGTLIGFGAFLIVPAAAVLAMLLVVTIPLSIVALVLFVCTLYLAKMPVALWVGRRVIGLVGGRDPSPFLALALGIVLLYAVFAVPYLGTLAWLVATWLGLGAIILAVRHHLRAGVPVSQE